MEHSEYLGNVGELHCGLPDWAAAEGRPYKLWKATFLFQPLNQFNISSLLFWKKMRQMREFILHVRDPHRFRKGFIKTGFQSEL